MFVNVLQRQEDGSVLLADSSQHQHPSLSHRHLLVDDLAVCDASSRRSASGRTALL